jgi:mono/diheme cytochrome c family protein
MVDFIGLGILVLLVIVFGYLTYRAWGSKNKILKWAGAIVAGLLTLLFAAGFVTAILGTMQLNANYNSTNPVREFNSASASPEAVAFGENYAKLCAGCHSPNMELPLTGSNFGAEFPVPLGTLYAPNLTPAGEIRNWSDGEVVRAIREGVHQSGRSLIIMPSEEFHKMSDEDVLGLVAYLRSQPAVEPNTPPNALNAIGAILINAMPSLTVQPHIAQPVPKPAVGVTAEYGKYVVDISVCRTCHGENLEGASSGFTGPAPSLAAVKGWSDADFVNVFRTGVVPGGRQLNPDLMPWKEFGEALSDTDLQAIHAYLMTVQ